MPIAPPLGFEALPQRDRDRSRHARCRSTRDRSGVNALAMICRARCNPGTTLVTTDPTGNGHACSRASRAPRNEIPIYDPVCNYRLTATRWQAHVEERTGSSIWSTQQSAPL